MPFSRVSADIPRPEKKKGGIKSTLGHTRQQKAFPATCGSLRRRPMTLSCSLRAITATTRLWHLTDAYINYAKFEELTDRGVVYVPKMKSNLNYEVLVDCMHQNPQGLMEYREQVVVFRKDGINHIARIITYVDIKKGKNQNSYRF